MQVPRLYTQQPLAAQQQVSLNEAESHYLLRVLRLKVGRELMLFNGDGGEYQAILLAQQKKTAILQLQTHVANDNRSPLTIHLIQAVSRGERMDYVIQKAVELGVTSITPVLSERCNVKLDEARVRNRLQHWHKIMIAACEQSGRCHLADIHPPVVLSAWLEQAVMTGFICHLDQHDSITQYQSLTFEQLNILVGPEGGFTEQEYAQAVKQGLLPLSLGPRVLRTETATVVALSLLQSRWGDL